MKQDKFSKDIELKASNRNVSSIVLAYEIDELKNEMQHLKDQTQMILKKIETFSDKIKSFKDLKEELLALISFNKYSVFLGTNNPSKKIFSMICLVTLFICCIVFVSQNVISYRSNEIVTQIKSIDLNEITFPAITFLLQDHNDIPRNLTDVFAGCYFEIEQNQCTLDDFDHFIAHDFENDLNFTCYKFNGGRNSSRHETKIFSTQHVGYNSGLTIKFNLSEIDNLWFFVSDNKIQPIYSEVNHAIEKKHKLETYILVEMQKTVDIKLPMPYSNCSENIDSQKSIYKINGQHMGYRQKNCYESCFYEYLKKYAVDHKMNNRDAYHELKFDYNGNCSKICPLECSSTSFEISQSSVAQGSTESSAVTVDFIYSERKYTVISQAIKTTGADFVSNTGGVLGLFLDISFYHAYRFFIFILGIIVN